MSGDQCTATTQPVWEVRLPWTKEVSGRKGEKVNTYTMHDLWNKQWLFLVRQYTHYFTDMSQYSDTLLCYNNDPFITVQRVSYET